MKARTQQELKSIFRALYDESKVLIACGKEVLVEVSEFKPRRTKAQNDFYWVFCTELADFLNEHVDGYGEFKIPYTKDIVHDINKKLWGISTTTKMNITDFCNYMHCLNSDWIARTHGEFQMSELPESYLIRKGYDLERNMR